MTGNGFQIITSGSPRVAVTPAEKVNILVDTQIDGNLTICGQIYRNSDRALKKDITPLYGALGKILDIKGVSYIWKDPHRGAGRQIGVIAQDVERNYPELVQTGEDGIKSVGYTGLIAPSIEAMRELLAKILGRDARIEKLEAKLLEYDRRLGALETENQKLGASLEKRTAAPPPVGPSKR